MVLCGLETTVWLAGNVALPGLATIFWLGNVVLCGLDTRDWLTESGTAPWGLLTVCTDVELTDGKVCLLKANAADEGWPDCDAICCCGETVWSIDRCRYFGSRKVSLKKSKELYFLNIKNYNILRKDW